MTANRYIIVVAAGSGKRMGASLPKQFLPIAGKPILMHTLERIHAFDPAINIRLVLHPDFFDYWKALVQEHHTQIPHQLIEGGEERFHSVKRAVDSISDLEAIVGIHDGVRPLVSDETLTRCFEKAEQVGNAVPVIPVNDSLRVIKDDSNHAVNRSHYRIVQTPQCFVMSELKKVFEQPFNGSFTDDASVVEAAGSSIHLVEGNRSNVKITSPEDLAWAEWSLGSGRV